MAVAKGHSTPAAFGAGLANNSSPVASNAMYQVTNTGQEY